MTDVVTTNTPSGPGNVGFETVTGMSDEAGRFTLLGVPPGEYVLQQANRFLSRALREVDRVRVEVWRLTTARARPSWRGARGRYASSESLLSRIACDRREILSQ